MIIRMLDWRHLRPQNGTWLRISLSTYSSRPRCGTWSMRFKMALLLYCISSKIRCTLFLQTLCRMRVKLATVAKLRHEKALDWSCACVVRHSSSGNSSHTSPIRSEQEARMPWGVTFSSRFMRRQYPNSPNEGSSQRHRTK